MALQRDRVDPVTLHRLGQVVAWAGMVTMVCVTLVLSVPRASSSETISLAGPWTAEVLAPMRSDPTTVTLPSRLQNVDFPEDAIVRLSRTVDLPPDETPWAFRAERVMYAARVLWDGQEIARSGDLSSGGVRRDAAVIAPIPTGAGGTHTVTLEVRGDFGSGGVLGELEVGPFPAVRRSDLQTEVGWAGFSIALAVMSIVHLAVAVRRKVHPAHLLFGVLTALISAWALMQPDLGLVPAGIRVRLEQILEAATIGVGLAFMLRLLYPERRPDLRAFGGLFVLPALWAIVPSRWMYAVEQTQDLVNFVVISVAAGLVVIGIRRRARDAPWLMLTLVPVIVGTAQEAAVDHGLWSGSSYLATALTLYAGSASAALVIRYAQEAERHERLVSGSADAMVGVDARTGQVTIVNPAAAALIGRDGRGETLLSWVDPEDRGVVRAHLQRSDRDRTEFRLVAAVKRIYVESLATRLDDHTVLLVLRDITRRRQLDAGLLHAARMETVGTLAGGIAHDFNNMLSTLLAHVGLLQASIEDPETQERLGKMETTIDRASLLTRRLLTLAGGTGADLAPTSIPAVCQAAADLVQPTLGTGVRLEVDVPDDLEAALAAAADIEQVLVNLLVNARDAVGGRGHIRLSARPYRVNNARGVAVIVDDDGPGVPDELKGQVFDPFFTTKGPRGSGLGLAVASQILRDHFGRLWVEDRPGGGGRFCVALRTADSGEDLQGPLPAGRKVLLVEDETPLREGYAAALRSAGYDVVACANGETAWQHLQDAPVDILVTDVVMPGLSGLELASLCQQKHPQTPILLVSGFIPEAAVATQGRQDWYRLDKPVRNNRLVQTVGRLRRRMERRNRGESDITEIGVLFPNLDRLQSSDLDWARG